MKVLITGSSGFLGKNLSEHLFGKYNLLLPSHSELDLLNERAVEDYLKNSQADVVIHAAAIGIVRGKNLDPETTQKNLRMFYNLANRGEFFKRMIFCGSGAVYNKRQNLNRVKEEDFGKTIPTDPYGAYKYECSKYIEQAQNIIDLRLFGVYGPYEDYATRFISNAICRAVFDISITIIKNVKFEYLYVKDFARIVELLIVQPAKYKNYNLGTGRPVDLLTLAQKIKNISGKDLGIEIKSEGFGNEYTCDNQRLMSELGEFKFSDLDASLKELYNWYVDNKHAIDPSKLFFDK